MHFALSKLMSGTVLQDEGSQYTSDGTVDINNQPACKSSTGNWRACYFILGTAQFAPTTYLISPLGPSNFLVLTLAHAIGAEFTEGICFFGIQKNLVTFLTTVLRESNVDAARNVSTWIGTCFFTPLIGAFLADTYWGRYWTIVAFLSVYTVVSYLFTKKKVYVNLFVHLILQMLEE